ncbi:MAG: replication factor C large subunit [Thermofilaceae archaeon]|nr:replication factor C large subunit [Thermofilaceae archaeon]MCX8180180.1 replication factor C large subunit [Thermofilaceae archaeon]MDW8004164.1 replication factor C large subunit [Thermofilaceae archaeon]
MEERIKVPWVEKYRPSTIDDVIGNPDSKREFIAWLNKWLAGKTPEKKAVILHGPPGCGKTSLVHAATKQLGLELVEVNASDVRTSEALRRRVLRAAIEGTLSGARSKIILLDEVDGISPREDAGGLETITEIIRSSRHPVVLTANDPWHPSLRDLRNLCELIEFKKIGVREIVKVLSDICKREGVDCDPAVIKAIAENSEGDLRAAINDLQSIAAGRRAVTLGDLEILGYRAKQLNMFEVVRIVLTSKRIESAKAVLSMPSLDYEMLIQWLNENIPYQYSPSLLAIADAYEALSKADVILARIKREQAWTLLPYALDLITAGVAGARDKPPFKFVKYNFPYKLRALSYSREAREEKIRIARAIARACHTSVRIALIEVVPYIRLIYENNPERGSLILGTLGIPEDSFARAFGVTAVKTRETSSFTRARSRRA